MIFIIEFSCFDQQFFLCYLTYIFHVICIKYQIKPKPCCLEFYCLCLAGILAFTSAIGLISQKSTSINKRRVSDFNPNVQLVKQ